MAAPVVAADTQNGFFTRSRSIAVGRTPPNWMRLTNSVADALEGSHFIAVLDESSERLTLKLSRRHIPLPGWWGASPTLVFTLAPDGSTLDFDLTWPEYGAALVVGALLVILSVSAESLFPELLVLPLLIAAAVYFDHRRVANRIDDAVRESLH